MERRGGEGCLELPSSTARSLLHLIEQRGVGIRPLRTAQELADTNTASRAIARSNPPI